MAEALAPSFPKKMWNIHVFIYPIEQYSASKNTEMMPLAAPWMDLKANTNPIGYHLDVESKIRYKSTCETETNLWVPRGEGE